MKWIRSIVLTICNLLKFILLHIIHIETIFRHPNSLSSINYRIVRNPFVRAYFREIKHPGIRRFIKGAFLEIFFSIWIKHVKNIFQLGWIQPPPVLLDCPSVFLSEKKCHFIEPMAPFSRIIWFNSFILDKQGLN